MSKAPILVGVLGIDGAGKTTHINFLRSYFIDRNFLVERPILRSPIREEAHRIAWELGKRNGYEVFDLNAMALLGAFEVLQSIQQYIWNPVQRRILLFDKYIDAFKAVATSHGLDDCSQIDLVYERFPKLDIQFYLKIDVNTALDRITQREGGTYENEEAKYLTKFKDIYDELIFNQSDIIIIDATQSLEAVQQIMIESLEQRLGGIG